MKTNGSAIVASVILLFVALGCGSLRNVLPKKGMYFQGDAAATAAAAIKDEIGKPFKVLEVFIDEDEFRVHAQDPNNPRNVDEYKYAAGS